MLPPHSMEAQALDDGEAAAGEAERERREALRKAGQDYVEKALAAARHGGNPFEVGASTTTRTHDAAAAPAPSSSAQAASASKPTSKPKQQHLDPDVAEFGRFYESNKVYLYSALYIVSQASLWVLLKGSLAAMKAPAVLSFLHMLAASATLWAAGSYELLDVREVLANPAGAAKGAAVRAALYGLQMLFLYGATLHSSINMVLCFVALVPRLLHLAKQLVNPGHAQAALPDAERPLLLAALALTGLEVLLDEHKSWLSFMLLGCWAAAKALEVAWQAIKEDNRLLDGLGVSATLLAAGISDAEDALAAPAMALLCNALPALPVLLLGFVGMEGHELVTHELSVPSTKMMLWSCAAHAGVVVAQLLLHGRLGAGPRATVKTLALLATVVLNYMEQTHHVRVVAALLTFGAVSATSAAVVLGVGPKAWTAIAGAMSTAKARAKGGGAEAAAAHAPGGV